MSIIKTIGKALGLSKSSKAVASVEAFVLTEAQKAVAALKKTAVGAAVAADIAGLTDSRLTGTQKFELVVANTLPLLVDVLKGGGITAIVKDVEDVGRALVQEVFNDTKSTKAASIASLILSILGLR